MLDLNLAYRLGLAISKLTAQKSTFRLSSNWREGIEKLVIKKKKEFSELDSYRLEVNPRFEEDFSKKLIAKKEGFQQEKRGKENEENIEEDEGMEHYADEGKGEDFY